MPTIGLEDSSNTYEAIKKGIRRFEITANNKVSLGIQQAIKEGVVKREELYVKAGVSPMTDRSPEGIRACCTEALGHCGLEYFDQFQIYSPLNFDLDEKTGKMTQVNIPLRVTWEAMEMLVKDKLVKHIGLS
jgi:diketogulonate reductase-like aldo/keto reductase